MHMPATITYERATHFDFYPSICDYLFQFSNRFRITASARSDIDTHEHMYILAGEKQGTGKDYDLPRLSCLKVSQRYVQVTCFKLPYPLFLRCMLANRFA